MNTVENNDVNADLAVTNVSYRVVANVSFTLSPGEVVGLQGHFGTGKTTLARIVAGHVIPTTGEVASGNKKIPGRGYCPVQLIQQHPEKAIDPRWRLRRVVDRIDQEVLDRLGIRSEWLSRRALEVSGGQLQRINIARAFDRRTRFIIADEITAALDGISAAQLWREIIAMARERNLGLLVISHQEALLERLSDRRLYLHHGVLTEEPYE